MAILFIGAEGFLAILIESDPGNIPVKLESHRPYGLEEISKLFTIFCF